MLLGLRLRKALVDPTGNPPVQSENEIQVKITQLDRRLNHYREVAKELMVEAKQKEGPHGQAP